MTTAAPATPPAPAPALPWPDELLRLINAARAELKLIPYLPDGRLALAAQHHAAWLTDPAARPDLWGLGACFAGWQERIAACGYPMGSAAAMLLAPGPASPEGAVKWWLANPPDKNAITSPAFISVGFANAMGPGGIHWWLAVLGGMSQAD